MLHKNLFWTSQYSRCAEDIIQKLQKVWTWLVKVVYAMLSGSFSTAHAFYQLRSTIELVLINNIKITYVYDPSFLGISSMHFQIRPLEHSNQLESINMTRTWEY